MILVTGCGHSGTTYTTTLLQELGLDVLHERLGPDGVVAWEALGGDDPDWLTFSPREVLRDASVILHQVREPLRVISSMHAIPEWPHPVWRYLAEHFPLVEDEPMILRCMKFWFYWNQKAEKVASWRFRVEDLSGGGEVYETFCGMLGVNPYYDIVRELPKNIGTQIGNRRQMAWNDIELADAQLAGDIRKMAVRYGYDA